MNDKTLVERLRELQNRDCACITQCDFVNAVGAKCCRQMQGYGCNLCFNVTIKAIIDAIESEYLPRPRFEDGEPVREGDTICIDGELPLKVYYRNVRNDGLTVFECPTSSRKIKTGERVKRHEPEVLDADGVPIHKGEVLYSVSLGSEKPRVASVSPFGGGHRKANGEPTVDYENGLWDLAADLTHKQPDSLELVETDIYEWIIDHKDSGGTVPVSEWVERIKALLERGR